MSRNANLNNYIHKTSHLESMVSSIPNMKLVGDILISNGLIKTWTEIMHSSN